jgi:hypothetical protein
MTPKQAMNMIKAGDSVTILLHAGIGRNGPEFTERTGKAVMRGPYGWVLNMGGRYGRPAVANEHNIVRIARRGK